MKAVPCRKSYVIVVSDGVWNGTVDPYVPAFDMHTKDLRGDTGLVGDQVVDVSTVFAFRSRDDLIYGTRSMKWTAMYGGFHDTSGCNDGAPYPQTKSSTVNTSKSTAFPPTTGSCGSTSANSCCKEWTAGKGTRLGWPDNYYEATSGDQLGGHTRDCRPGGPANSSVKRSCHGSPTDRRRRCDN